MYEVNEMYTYKQVRRSVKIYTMVYAGRCGLVENSHNKLPTEAENGPSRFGMAENTKTSDALFRVVSLYNHRMI